MLLPCIPMPLIRVERANPHARLPFRLDEFEPVLIHFRLKESAYHAWFDVHVAGATIGK